MRFRFRFLVLALFAWALGCQTEVAPPGIGDDPGGTGTMTCIDRDGDGFGFNCSRGIDCDDNNAAITNQCYICAHDEPGCPCTTEGARASCGKVTARVGDQTTCGYGSTVCAGGMWGECVLDGTTRSFTSARKGLGLAPPTACLGNVCDPYCKQYPDTPDESLTTHTGIIGTEAGLTVDTFDAGVVYQPNGPMPDRIKTQLVDAGLYPDAAPDAIIYHELPPTVTAQDDVTGTATIKAADVYFMNYTSGDDGVAASNLWFYMDVSANVFEQVRAGLPDAWIGLGRYEQYDKFGWNWTGHPTIAYQHVTTITNDPDKQTNGLDWIHNRFYDTGKAGTLSWIDALFAMSTTAGLRGSFGGYWAFPRANWSSPSGGDSSPCPLGWRGYPCFRPWALPITVLFAQSPSNNGPGGQYAYAHNSTYGISGSATWPPNTPVTGNYTEATAYALDPVEQYHGYSGTTLGAMSNQYWHWAPSDTCPTGRGNGIPNVFFKFHASQRTSFHFDTFGSAIDTAIYMYTAAGNPVVCNDHHFFTGNPTIIPASIDGYVDAGDYFVVVDGFASVDVGNYVLHVGAMPDGANISDPNYDETVAAFNALGAKFVSVDTSGYTCDHATTAFVLRNTGNALDRFSIDTGSVDGTGAPYKVMIQADDGVCHAADDPRLENQVARAIRGVFNSTATSRMDVTAVAVDVDDPIDFDGPPGGATILTPTNIDDATFVQSITTVATAATDTNCQQTMPDRFIGCAPGTQVTFRVTFATPATVTPLDHEQIFTFVIRTLRNGTLVLSETPVVLVVPPIKPAAYVDAWFIRDYDTTDACPTGTAPRWGFFSWDALTPGDSQIDFEIAVANSVAELPTSIYNDSLLFSNPPGPAVFAGQPIGVRAGIPDTRFGGTLVDATIAANGWPRDSRAMRLRAHLMPSFDKRQAPVLQLWNQQISCQPAE
jgi:hypothetical protein